MWSNVEVTCLCSSSARMECWAAQASQRVEVSMSNGCSQESGHSLPFGIPSLRAAVGRVYHPKEEAGTLCFLASNTLLFLSVMKRSGM